MPLDQQLLVATLERLRGDVLDSVEDALQRVVDATRTVFAVTGAGLMFVDDHHALRYVVASDEASRVLEVAQEEVGRGPCVDSFVADATVATSDVTVDGRWPALATWLHGTGIHAVLGTPVRLGGGPIGTLNTYADLPRPWEDDEVEAIEGFAGLIEHVIGLAVVAHRDSAIVDQLQQALDHRVVIERAIGVLMERDSVDAVTAFNGLRRAARDAGRRVVEVAETITGADRV